jgi:hypothetical protein
VRVEGELKQLVQRVTQLNNAVTEERFESTAKSCKKIH